MRIFRFHSYKKVQSFSEKEKLYMDDAKFVWNFLTYRDIARTRESRQQSSARTALGPSRPQRLTCSRRRAYIPATVLFGGNPWSVSSCCSVIYNYPRAVIGEHVGSIKLLMCRELRSTGKEAYSSYGSLKGRRKGLVMPSRAMSEHGPWPGMTVTEPSRTISFSRILRMSWS
mgnify:FL=1